MIPKNIFFIWLGDKLPTYTQFAIDAYKKINPEFNIIFLFYTIKDLEDIYYTDTKDKNIYTQLLYNSILNIFQAKTEYKQFLYRFLTDNNTKLYGKDLRFIQVLCDIYRLELINNIGGIYIDLDTFPLKPFDDALLKNNAFIVKKHINASSYYPITVTDNYFLGSDTKEKIYYNDQPNIPKLIQTDDKWWTSIDFLINKKKFFQTTLTHGEHTLNNKFYIEHYCDSNWRDLPIKGIRTPYCFLDHIYKNIQLNIS